MFQDISYGTHDSTLDMYWPRGKGTDDRCPVVVFVYGGTWASGDKAMYALLCTHVADALQVIVCCPNYATYPKVRFTVRIRVIRYCEFARKLCCG